MENALRHALPTIDGPLTIRISVRKSGEFVRIAVADNGCGMTENELTATVKSFGREDHKSKLTGLTGLNTRLKYYYPGIGDLALQNTSLGFAVSISIPA